MSTTQERMRDWHVNKAKRERVNQENQLMQLAETALLPAKLEKDKYLASKMDENGRVAVAVLAAFPKAKTLLAQLSPHQDNVTAFKEVLLRSTKLQVSENPTGTPVVRLATASAPAEKQCQPQLLQKAQQMWLSLTALGAGANDEVSFSLDQLLSLSSQTVAAAQAAEALPSPPPRLVTHPQLQIPQQQQQPEDNNNNNNVDPSPKAASPKGVLAAVLATPFREPVAPVPAASPATPPPDTFDTEAWADKSAKRRYMFKGVRARGMGYNTGMIAVAICKGPEGPGFPAGRGKPLLPPAE